jgi:hypothetical protein
MQLLDPSGSFPCSKKGEEKAVQCCPRPPVSGRGEPCPVQYIILSPCVGIKTPHVGLSRGGPSEREDADIGKQKEVGSDISEGWCGEGDGVSEGLITLRTVCS